MNWEKHFRAMKREKYSTEYSSQFGGDNNVFGVLMPDSILMSDNLVATDNYFHQTLINTPAAASLASDWARWWMTTGNPDNYWFSIPDAVWDEARNRKFAFDLANYPDQVARLKEEAKTNFSTEQMRGEPDRRDPTTGTFPVPKPAILPSWGMPVVLGAAALGVGISIIPLIRKILFPV
jgi:hypothetical protein